MTLTSRRTPTRLVVATLLALGFVAVLPTDAAEAATVSTAATADTYVASATPSTVFGAASPLWATNNAYKAFLRFDVSSLVPTDAHVDGVKLVLNVTNISTSSAGVQVYATDGNWNETSSTWSNTSAERATCDLQASPAPTPLASSPAPSGTGAFSIALPTSSIPSSGPVNFCVVYTAVGSQFQFTSREGSVAPSLSVAYTPYATTESSVLTFQDTTLTDSSSWAVSHRTSGIRWTNEDRTYQHPVAWAIAANGQTLSKVTMTGAGMSNIDPEDLSTVTLSGTPYVYVEDGGGNLDKRTSIIVHRFVEPTGATLSANSTLSVAADTWVFNYPTGSGTEFDPNRTAGPDSEAMLVNPQNGKMFFFIKSTLGQASGVTGLGVYASSISAASTPGTYTLTKVATVSNSAPTAPSTAASFAPDGRSFALRTYNSIAIYAIASGGDVVSALGTTPYVIKPVTTQQQGEGVSFSADGKALELSTEEHKATIEPVLRESLPPSRYVAAVTLIP